MLNLAAAALTFLALHRIVSGSQVRDRIVASIGKHRSGGPSRWRPWHA